MSQPTIGSPDTGPSGATTRQQDSPGPVHHPLSASDERTWAVVAHLSSFVAAYLALGLLGPLTVMLLAGPRSAFVRRHAVEALNFNISVLIYLAIAGVLSLVLIGIPMLIAIGVLYVISVIRGAIAASRGEEFRYPLTLRLVN